MNQPIADELISAYFDGEVTPAEREQVERLLETSIEFRQQLEDTSKLSALLHSIPSMSAPAELAENVESQLLTATVSTPLVAVPKKQSLRREWTAFGAGIMATMASLLLYVSLNRSPSFSVQQTAAHSNAGLAVVEQRPEALQKLDNQMATANATLGLSKDAALGMTEGQTQFGVDASLPQMVATRSLEDENLSAATVGLQVANTIEPPQNEEFLQSLKDGIVIGSVIRQFVDPSNAVAVVEFTVVDVDRGAEGIKLLLNRRSVNTVEDDATKMSNESKEALTRQDREPGSKSDELRAIYVRAPGSELFETISESLKDHPDLYRRFATQLPIELPANSNAIANRETQADSANGPTTALAASPTNDQQTVEFEGNLAVNSYVNQNGLSVAVPAKRDSMARAMVSSAAASSTVAGNDKLPADSVGKLDRARKSGERVEMAGKSAAVALKEMRANRSQETGNASQGYATFRVGLDSQHQSAQQTPVPNSNFAMRSKSNQMNNNGLPFNPQGLNFPGNQNLAKMARSSTDNRDPRLVRMLIVLKPESRATVP